MKLGKKHGSHIYYANGLVHTFQSLVPAGKYYKDHPEYFMMKDGVRRKGQQLCLSNPDVLKIVIKRIKEVLHNDPNAKFVSVSQPDGASGCECPKCKALDEKEGSPSASVINFVNKVGEAIEKEYPDAMIETLAYQYTRKPPKTLKPRRNVVPRLCSIECEFSKPLAKSSDAENNKFRQDIEKWSRISNRLLIWDYITCFHPYIMPFPNFNALQPNLQFFRDHHVCGVLSMGDYNGQHGEFAQLRAWIVSKLHWNPDQDIEILYKDFFEGYYGPAAKYVREYFDGLQELAKPKTNELKFRTPITAPWFKRKFFLDAKKSFDKAEESVNNDPKRLFNVRTASIPVYYALIETWPKFRATQKWENGSSKMLGVPKGYAKLAGEIFRRMNEAKMYRPDEYVHWSAKFRYDMRKYSAPAKPIIISSEKVTAGVIPSLGGMLSILKVDDINYINPKYGGIGFTLSPDRFGSRWGSTSMMEGENTLCFEAEPTDTGSTSMMCYFEMPDLYRIERIVSANKGGEIDINTRIKRHRPEPYKIAPQFRLAIDLGDVDSLYYRVGQGKWQFAGVPENRTFLNTVVRNDKLNSTELTIASAKTRRGIKLHLPRPEKIERIWITASTRKCPLKISIDMKKETLPSNCLNTWTEYRMRVTPCKNISGLPQTVEIQKHHAAIIEIEDDMLAVGNPGWGNFVNDSQADNSRSVQLNTYPTWAMTWDVKPELFTPGAKYIAKIRIRVEKSGVPGEAFYAGIYNSKTRKDIAKLAPNVSATNNRYQWYTLGEFTPSDNLKIWIGPGRYDKKGGKASAVKHVYIDKIIFTKVK